MFKAINKLQSKSHSHRKRVALGVSGVTTLLVALVWVSVFDFTPESPSARIVYEKEALVASPFDSLKDDFTALKNQFKEEEGVYYEEDEDAVIMIVDSPQIPVSDADISFTYEENDAHDDY